MFSPRKRGGPSRDFKFFTRRKAMCGIFGFFLSQGARLGLADAQALTKLLLIESESRGKEASGLAIRTGRDIQVLKGTVSSAKLVRSWQFQDMTEFGQSGCAQGGGGEVAGPLAVIGHSRLVTHGGQESPCNNQPVVKDGVVCIHNGIIVNVDELWRAHPGIEKKYEVDTEVLASLLRMHLGRTGSLAACLRRTFRDIKGSASVAVFLGDLGRAVLATNTGSLYLARNPGQGMMVFASEKFLLAEALEKALGSERAGSYQISQINPGTGCLVDYQSLECSWLRFDTDEPPSGDGPEAAAPPLEIKDLGSVDDRKALATLHERVITELSPASRESMAESWRAVYEKAELRRCTRCVLPETVPFLEFDENGVCNRCRNHRPIVLRGEEALERLVAPYRKNTGEPDCLVAFSGGRDSSYGLHYVKNVLGLKPVAFTYDWGMVTDLGRRNQARIVGKLGVEHIIVSADITVKRNYIRKNIEAWFRQPDLGMIPLLMAGDKPLMHFAQEIMRRTGVKLLVHSYGNGLEEGNHKIGFCGIHVDDTRPHQQLPIRDKAKLMAYYGRQYLQNPGYINRSLWDTLFAYWSIFMLRDESVHLFRYIPWNEDQLIDLLVKEYDWELESDTIATWRIDDGTTSFYNYVYLAVVGFTEFDMFRSAQIREGAMTRERAMELIKEENKPRMESFEWYSQTIGFDCNRAVEIINSMPKLYKSGSSRFSKGG
jgi:glutamine---fructose-6-phosphate transaminase (isomerizing)